MAEKPYNPYNTSGTDNITATPSSCSLSGYRCSFCGQWVYDSGHTCSPPEPATGSNRVTCDVCGCLYLEGTAHVCLGTFQQPYTITWPPDPTNRELKEQLDRIERMMSELLGRQ